MEPAPVCIDTILNHHVYFLIIPIIYRFVHIYWGFGLDRVKSQHFVSASGSDPTRTWKIERRPFLGALWTTLRGKSSAGPWCFDWGAMIRWEKLMPKAEFSHFWCISMMFRRFVRIMCLSDSQSKSCDRHVQGWSSRAHFCYSLCSYRLKDLQYPYIRDHIRGILQNDFILLESYTPSTLQKLPLPLCALCAKGAHVTSKWRECFTFQLRVGWPVDLSFLHFGFSCLRKSWKYKMLHRFEQDKNFSSTAKLCVHMFENGSNPPGDARVRPQQLSAWIEVTTGTFQERWFEAPMNGVGTDGWTCKQSTHDPSNHWSRSITKSAWRAIKADWWRILGYSGRPCFQR